MSFLLSKEYQLWYTITGCQYKQAQNVSKQYVVYFRRKVTVKIEKLIVIYVTTVVEQIMTKIAKKSKIKIL